MLGHLPKDVFHIVLGKGSVFAHTGANIHRSQKDYVERGDSSHCRKVLQHPIERVSVLSTPDL